MSNGLWLSWIVLGGQDNDTTFYICEKIFCIIVLVPRNLTNKFQPLDISVNRPAKSFMSNKFNIWYSGIVRDQLSRGVFPKDIKVSMKLSELKPLHAQWIVGTYNYMQTQNESIVKGFDKAGITEAVVRANDVMVKCENPFEDHGLL